MVIALLLAFRGFLFPAGKPDKQLSRRQVWQTFRLGNSKRRELARRPEHRTCSVGRQGRKKKAPLSKAKLIRSKETIWASLVAQTVKSLPATQGNWFQSLGWEDSLERRMANPSSIPAWRIPRIEEPGGPYSMGSQRVRLDWVINTFTSLSKRTHSLELRGAGTWQCSILPLYWKERELESHSATFAGSCCQAVYHN